MFSLVWAGVFGFGFCFGFSLGFSLIGLVLVLVGFCCCLLGCCDFGLGYLCVFGFE